MAASELVVKVDVSDLPADWQVISEPIPQSLDSYMESVEGMTARELAEQTHRTIKSRGKRRMIEYILDGLALYVFKERRGYAEIGYNSYNEYLCDPETHLDGGKTYGHQCVATIALFHVLFSAPLSDMLFIGFHKFMLINPEAKALQKSVLDGSLSYEYAQAIAFEWLRKARDMSDDDLEAELHEESVEGIGATTYFSGPVTMELLKGMDAREMLQFFGIATLRDEQIVVVQMRGQ